MCRKRMLDKVPLTELSRLTGLQPIMNRVRARKLRWYGHIKRCSLPVKVAVEGNVPGNRGRGRPRRRWRDDIKEWTKKSWSDLNCLVKDREKWKVFIKNSL